IRILRGEPTSISVTAHLSPEEKERRIREIFQAAADRRALAQRPASTDTPISVDAAGAHDDVLKELQDRWRKERQERQSAAAPVEVPPEVPAEPEPPPVAPPRHQGQQPLFLSPEEICERRGW